MRSSPALVFRGLFAAISHAGVRTYTLRTRVRHAEGMRACTHGATHRSDSVARSTPTAPRSKQERPKMIDLHLF